MTPSKSKTAPLNTIPTLLLRLRTARPGFLSGAVSFQCADINQEFGYSIRRHASNNLRQDVKPEIGWTLGWNEIQKTRRGQHQTGKGQIPNRHFRLFHKITNHASRIDLNNAASRRFRNFINSNGGHLSMVFMKSKHFVEIRRREDVRIKHPKALLRANPI